MALDWIGRERVVRECLKSFKNNEEHVRNFFLKLLLTDFQSVEI